jgi:hypothetical protein
MESSGKQGLFMQGAEKRPYGIGFADAGASGQLPAPP